jgi:hypothetical protein
LLLVVGHNPVGWAKGVWYNVKGAVEAVEIDSVTAQPPGSVAAGFTASGATDGRFDTSWATAWRPAAAIAPCGQSTNSGQLRLVLKQPARLRAIDVLRGLPQDDPERLRFWQPMTLDVSWPGDCARLSLDPVSKTQRLKFDTKNEVTEVRISVAMASRPKAQPPENLVALTDVWLFSRPR